MRLTNFWHGLHGATVFKQLSLLTDALQELRAEEKHPSQRLAEDFELRKGPSGSRAKATLVGLGFRV